MENKFTVTYEVDDGYAGGSRPKHLRLDSGWIEEDMSDDDLEEQLAEMVHEDFLQRVSWYYRNKDAALEWAKSIRDKMADGDNK